MARGSRNPLLCEASYNQCGGVVLELNDELWSDQLNSFAANVPTIVAVENGFVDEPILNKMLNGAKVRFIQVELKLALPPRPSVSLRHRRVGAKRGQASRSLVPKKPFSGIGLGLFDFTHLGCEADQMPKDERCTRDFRARTWPFFLLADIPWDFLTPWSTGLPPDSSRQCEQLRQAARAM